MLCCTRCVTHCRQPLPTTSSRASLPPAEPHGAAARHCRLCRNPSAATGRRAGPLQPEIHFPQRDHGRGLVLPDTRGAQGRDGRPRRARGVESCRLPTLIRRPRAQATRRHTTRTSSSTRITRTAWCTASETRGHLSRAPPWPNLCLRSSPEAAWGFFRGIEDLARVPR